MLSLHGLFVTISSNYLYTVSQTEQYIPLHLLPDVVLKAEDRFTDNG